MEIEKQAAVMTGKRNANTEEPRLQPPKTIQKSWSALWTRGGDTKYWLTYIGVDLPGLKVYETWTLVDEQEEAAAAAPAAEGSSSGTPPAPAGEAQQEEEAHRTARDPSSDSERTLPGAGVAFPSA